MGKYTSSARRPPPPPRDRIPPLVRGIGCLMFVLIPILAYGIARPVVTYATQRAWPIPRQWLGPPNLSAIPQNLPLVGDLVALLRGENNLVANLVFMVVISVVLYGIMSIVYGYVYSVAAPSKYGPMDVPPPRVKTKKYRR
jgi:hypothetical protein